MIDASRTRGLPPGRTGVAALVMGWVFLSGLVGTGLIGPNRVAIEREYGLSHSAFGLGLATIQILAAVAMLLVAPRLKRLPNLTVLAGGLLVQVLGFAAVALTRASWGLLLGWACITLGTVAGGVANNVSMRLWAGNPRLGVVLQHAINALGKVAGPLVVGACLLMGWRVSFLAVGMITAVLAVFYLAARHTEVEGVAAPPAHHGPRALTDPWYWASLVPFGLIAGGEAAFVTLAPAFLKGQYGLTDSAAALMLTVHLLGLAAGRFLTAGLGARVSNNAIIALCLAMAPTVLLVVFVPVLWVAYPALFLLGLLFSSTWPTYYAQGAQHNGGRLDLFAYGSALGTAGGIALCVLVSSRVADTSLPLSLLVGPGALLLFGALYFGTRLSHPPAPAPPPIAPVEVE